MLIHRLFHPLPLESAFIRGCNLWRATDGIYLVRRTPCMKDFLVRHGQDEVSSVAATKRRNFASATIDEGREKKGTWDTRSYELSWALNLQRQPTHNADGSYKWAYRRFYLSASSRAFPEQEHVSNHGPARKGRLSRDGTNKLVTSHCWFGTFTRVEFQEQRGLSEAYQSDADRGIVLQISACHRCRTWMTMQEATRCRSINCCCC